MFQSRSWRSNSHAGMRACSNRYCLTSAFDQPAFAIVSAMIGLITTSGRSVPWPWLVVNVICQLLKRSSESAR